MILAAHQAGWLHSCIEHKDEAKRPRQTRADAYREAGVPPPFIAILAGQYLLDALFDAGPVKHDPMTGALPLDWVDIQAYVALTGALSEPWEAQTLRHMSQAYERGLREGADPFSIMPSERNS